jgi:hypothetical protein
MDGLQDEFDVGIYNLNYDNLAVAALTEFYPGFSGAGQFDPCGVHERTEWSFIYHLHGSVHHTLKGNSTASIQWQMDLNSEFTDEKRGQPINKTTDGKSFPLSTLIAGGFKLDQLLIEPFHSFYAASNARHSTARDSTDEFLLDPLRHRLSQGSRFGTVAFAKRPATS